MVFRVPPDRGQCQGVVFLPQGGFGAGGLAHMQRLPAQRGAKRLHQLVGEDVMNQTQVPPQLRVDQPVQDALPHLLFWRCRHFVAANLTPYLVSRGPLVSAKRNSGRSCLTFRPLRLESANYPGNLAILRIYHDGLRINRFDRPP